MTVRSCERSLSDFRRTTSTVQGSHAAAFVQQYAPRRQALERGAATMPPLVDDVGTLYFADGVVVRATPASASRSSNREPVGAENDGEYADMPALVDGAGEPSGAAAAKEPSLTAWLDSCAWPRDATVMASSLDPMRFSAANSFTARAQSDAGEAVVEPTHGPPSAGFPAAGGARDGLFAARSSAGIRRSSLASDHAAAAAAELEVRRLEVKLLRMQLLLTKKQLEQLTEDAEALDDFKSFDEEAGHEVGAEGVQRDVL
ncbi:hypothetical protein JCM9279_007364 [Rhodotorula babjevae]